MRRFVWVIAMLVFPLVLCAQGQWLPGRVTFTDGTTRSFPALIVPDYATAGLLVSNTDDHLDLVLFDANDIDYVEFWHTSFPDKVYRLYSVRLKHQRPRSVAHFWGEKGITTECGYIVTCYHQYMVTEAGELQRKTLYNVKNFRSPHPFALLPGEPFYQEWPVTPSCLYDVLYRDAGTRVGGGANRQDFDPATDLDPLDPMLSAFEEGTM